MIFYAINNKLDDKESKEGIRDLFIGDPNSDTITLSSLKKKIERIGRKYER